MLASLHRERPTEGFDRLALEASELSRARSLLDVLATSSIDIRAGVDATLLDRERALRQRLADKDVARHRAVDNGQASDAAGLEREIAELTDALRTTESAIAASGPGFAALTRPRAVDLDALRRDVLDDDTVLLEYAVGNDRTWLFALTPTTLDTFDLAGRTRLNPVVRAAIDAVTARQRDAASQDAAHDAALRTALGELSTQLLGPIADRLRGAVAGQAARRGGVGCDRIRAVRGPAAARRRRGHAGGPARRGPRGRGRAVGRGDRGAAARDRRPRAGHEDAGHRRRSGVRGGRSARRARAPDAGGAAPPPAAGRAPAPVPATLVASRGTTREPLGRLLFSRREATALTAMLPAAERLVVTDFAATPAVGARGAARSLPHRPLRHARADRRAAAGAVEPGAVARRRARRADRRLPPHDGHLQPAPARRSGRAQRLPHRARRRRPGRRAGRADARVHVRRRARGWSPASGRSTIRRRRS